MINIKINTNIEKLYDKYEVYLNKPIGSGSYSTVYLGKIIDPEIMKTHNLSNDTIAIKKIKINNIDSRSFKLINDEVNIMQKLIKCGKTCPNIIKCYDILEEYDYIYLILEYCEDGDLSQIIGKPIKETIVKYYFSQLVNALYFLYDNNIIHRDIKPKNILLKNNKKDIVLCDFGFARIKNSIKKITTICGSPLYMAPELLEAKGYSEIVDVWAIGMILYEMIYGEHPYNECRDISDLKEFSKKDITIPPENNLNKNISSECLDLMKKMLNKEELSRINLKTLFSHSWIKDSINISFVPFNKIYKMDNDSNNEISDCESDDYKPPRRSRTFSESSNESIDNNDNDNDNDNDDDDILIGNIGKFELGSDSPKPQPKSNHKYSRSISFQPGMINFTS